MDQQLVIEDVKKAVVWREREEQIDSLLPFFITFNVGGMRIRQ